MRWVLPPRRAWWAIGLIMAVAVVTIGALGLGGPAVDDHVARSSTTTQVQRRTLVQRSSVDGRLGFGAEIPLSVKATGTVTWLPAVGSVISRNGALLRVDDRPVTLLYGQLPMYRRLGIAPAAAPPSPDPEGATGSAQGASTGPTKGKDVHQLEANLAALGYRGFTVDETFTDQTARAVSRWQRDLGLPETGAVEIGDVYYSTGPIRVNSMVTRLGASAAGDLYTYTGTERIVLANAPVGTTDWAVRGTAVEISLPDGRVLNGTVRGVGNTVTTADSGEPGADQPQVQISIDIGPTPDLDTLAASPATVSYVKQRHENVLTVPAAALVALAEGGYGLEVVDGSASHFVAVETGLFADGLVEVSGPGVAEGMTVRLPA